jgi:hypothetical protein
MVRTCSRASSGPPPLIDVRYFGEEKLLELSIMSLMILYEDHSIRLDSLM